MKEEYKKELIQVLEDDIASEWISNDNKSRFLVAPKEPKSYIYAILDESIKLHGEVDKLEDLPDELFELMHTINEEPDL